MSYEMVNEKLNIKACRITDLTANQVGCFLSQWEEGATIGTLTLFFDKKNGDLILNKDNKNYDLYLKLAEAYLGASEKDCEEIRSKCKIRGFEGTIEVLENCIKYRETDKQIKLLKF